MLSATNTIDDVKAELVKDYTYYGYASDNLFETQLTLRVEDVKLLEIIPQIGESYYDTIAAKDKVALSTIENYIYRAEIAFTCSAFLSKQSQRNNQTNSGGYESIIAEGYSRTITAGGSATGMESMSLRYWQEGNKYLAMAGYKNALQLKRGNSSLSGFEDEVSEFRI